MLFTFPVNGGLRYTSELSQPYHSSYGKLSSLCTISDRLGGGEGGGVPEGRRNELKPSAVAYRHLTKREFEKKRNRVTALRENMV